ncbi:hypothetical protein CPT_Sansa58 [Caulobacter phage Sansa]|uniref:Uncharacterized protein n=1 Tax=Caulobacter phage Sansa TaxID=1675600 RepID=A0A0K1LLS5_9CAUD|nr:hypothetical protein HOR07_gp058 [Caulobacter phage Sansa]AKU43462.1 hypothetical protein CPT_Sansa58 [Caulobacter phage Sansa]
MITMDNIRTVRRMKEQGFSFTRIRSYFARLPRQVVQEIWWAVILRTDEQAFNHVHRVLDFQHMDVALVNGRPLIFTGDLCRNDFR